MDQLKDYQNNYNPYYDLYLKNLNSLDSIQERLVHNHKLIFNFFNEIEDEKYHYAYADDKWNIGQILQHIIDTERIFCYRALKIVREDKPIIKSYDHEDYALNASFKSKQIHLEDYQNNRLASLSLFKTFDEDDLKKSINFGSYKFSVGLIPFIFCGHELHHAKVIKSTYLK